METFDLYKDMKLRTGGEIYIGVVGPVRTGKSTFIKHFMDEMVLPVMTEEAEKVRATDEMPQSAQGRTIMTTEPKFVPKEAAKIALPDGTDVKIRLVDCVGYMVEGAVGHMEGEKERMIKTPWSETEIPFTKAAEIGTGKVIREHSTVGVLVTADGSFGELTRENYEVPEERTIHELKRLGKPFIVLLNSARPRAAETEQLAKQLAERYDVIVLPTDCTKLKKAELTEVLEAILTAFPVSEMKFRLPMWIDLLEQTHEIKREALECAKELLLRNRRIRDVREQKELPSGNYFERVTVSGISMEDGSVEYRFEPKKEYYYGMLSELLGCEVTGERRFYRELRALAKRREEYEKIAAACEEVEQKGYGVVLPAANQIQISTPELIKQGGKFGVKIRATAPSIHMIQADIVTEIAPIVGSEEQAGDLISYMTNRSEQEEDGLRTASIFGKSVNQLVEDGVNAKIGNINEECQGKLQESIEKIINESSGGVICFII
ncbi:MAG: stage IV sporulation protein A [Lachnospiraceae bacterium]|nr:stage IV sporulation protein A [Lachnospiraceae bacterium]